MAQSGGLKDALHDQEHQDTGDQDDQGDQHGADVAAPVHWSGAAAGGGSDQMGLAQRGHDGLVDEHGDGGVQGVLAQVKGQEHRAPAGRATAARGIPM